MTELFEDWGRRNQVAPRPGARDAPASLPSAKSIGRALAGFEPAILNVLCFEDVGYPWVQVVFDEIIGPGVALDVGAALATAVGADKVYLNSLRPQAVYFVLEPALDPDQELPASRYGALLADVVKAWR
jgi:hypothetical protein